MRNGMLTATLLGLMACGGNAPDACIQMLECDTALAQANRDYIAIYPLGVDDPSFGDGGTCYRGDRKQCIETCENAVENQVILAESYVRQGLITDVPEVCL